MGAQVLRSMCLGDRAFRCFGSGACLGAEVLRRLGVSVQVCTVGA